MAENVGERWASHTQTACVEPHCAMENVHSTPVHTAPRRVRALGDLLPELSDSVSAWLDEFGAAAAAKRVRRAGVHARKAIAVGGKVARAVYEATQETETMQEGGAL